MPRARSKTAAATEADAGDATPAPVPPRVFFIHVMKTGGMTLLENVRKHYAVDEVYPDSEIDVVHDASKPVAFRHLTIRNLQVMPEARRHRIRFLAGHFPYVAGAVFGGGFETVTILRDPIERTLSLLRQFQRPAPWGDRSQSAPLGSLSLEEVYAQPHVYEPLVHNHQTKIFSMTLADQPTGYMQLIDVDESRLELAKENLAHVDVVGLTERYDDFLDLVTERYGWRVKRGARVNASPATEEPPASEALRRRIASDNSIDVELYEYATAMVDARHRRRTMPA